MSAVVGSFTGGRSKISSRRASGRLLCTWALTAETGKQGGGRLLCSGRLLGILRYLYIIDVHMKVAVQPSG